MAVYDLGEVVVERQLEATGADGDRRTVTVRIGKPFPDPLPGGDWCCPLQIVGLGDEAVKAAFGVDSMQAILLAVTALRLHLADRAATASVSLDWLHQPDLGLRLEPVPAADE